MKQGDVYYDSYIALTKIATKEQPVTTLKELRQAEEQIKAVNAMCRIEATECRKNELPLKQGRLVEDRLTRQTELYKFQIIHKLPIKSKLK
jgi:hypothetical protein